MSHSPKYEREDGEAGCETVIGMDADVEPPWMGSRRVSQPASPSSSQCPKILLNILPRQLADHGFQPFLQYRRRFKTHLTRLLVHSHLNRIRLGSALSGLRVTDEIVQLQPIF